MSVGVNKVTGGWGSLDNRLGGARKYKEDVPRSRVGWWESVGVKTGTFFEGEV